MNLYQNFRQIDDGVWSNFQLNPKIDYRIFIGHRRYTPIADPMNPVFERDAEESGKKHEVIYITNPVFEKEDKNIIILDDYLENDLKNGLNPMRAFLSVIDPKTYKEIDKRFREGYLDYMVRNILENQNQLYLNVYFNAFRFQEDSSLNGRVKIIAPNRKLVEEFDDKFNHNQVFEESGVPYVTGIRVSGNDSIRDLLSNDYINGMFVTRKNGTGGSGSRILRNPKQIDDDPFFSEGDNEYLVKNIIDVIHNPTVYTLIANPDQIKILPIIDQTMNKEKETSISGCRYPSYLTPDQKHYVQELVKKVSENLASKGYVGLVNYDLMLDDKESVLFSEINPRWGGSSIEYINMLNMMRDEETEELPVIVFNMIENGYMPKVNFTERPEINWERKRLLLTKGRYNISGNPLDVRTVFEDGIGVTYTRLPLGKIDVVEDSYIGNITAVSNDSEELDCLMEKGERFFEENVAFVV